MFRRYVCSKLLCAAGPYPPSSGTHSTITDPSGDMAESEIFGNISFYLFLLLLSVFVYCTNYVKSQTAASSEPCGRGGHETFQISVTINCYVLNVFLLLYKYFSRTATIKKEKIFKSTSKIVKTTEKRFEDTSPSSSEDEAEEFRNPMFPSL